MAVGSGPLTLGLVLVLCACNRAEPEEDGVTTLATETAALVDQTSADLIATIKRVLEASAP